MNDAKSAETDRKIIQQGKQIQQMKTVISQLHQQLKKLDHKAQMAYTASQRLQDKVTALERLVLRNHF